MRSSRVEQLFITLRSRRQVAHLPLDRKMEVFDQLRSRYPELQWHEFVADFTELEEVLKVAGAEAERLLSETQTEVAAVKSIGRQYPELSRECCEALLAEALFANR